MRRLLFPLCLLASALTARASYDVVYWNTNFDSQFTPQYGQKILVSPIYFSNSIAPLQPRMYSCGAVGSTYPAGFIISNMLSGRYTFDIQSTPRSTPLIFVVPDGSGTYTLSIADKVATPAGTGFPSYADITNYVNAHAGSSGSATNLTPWTSDINGGNFTLTNARGGPSFKIGVVSVTNLLDGSNRLTNNVNADTVVARSIAANGNATFANHGNAGSPLVVDEFTGTNDLAELYSTVNGRQVTISSNADITIGAGIFSGNGSGLTNLTWITGLSNEFNIFNTIATATVAACRFNYANDPTFGLTNSWRPAGDETYDFFFLRDTVMSMGAAPHLFSGLDFTNILLQAKSLQPSQSYENAGMDSGILADGEGPTSGGNGEDYDGVFYLTRIAYEGWKKTGSLWFYTNVQTQVSNAMAFYAVSNHLAYITNAAGPLGRGLVPGWGFEDSVQLYGVPAMLNGLRHEACRELSEMHAALGHAADALWYTNECGFIRTNLQAALWDSSRGLFFACTTPTTNATKYDLAASAYIAMVGACSNGIQQQIGFTLADYLTAGPFKHGSMAHLPSDQNWFEVLAGDQGPGNYQNGGYWPLLGVYAAIAIRNVNKELADNSMRKLAGRYTAQSTSVVPPEWENGTAYGAPQYLVSGCAPLAYFLGINR